MITAVTETAVFISHLLIFKRPHLTLQLVDCADNMEEGSTLYTRTWNNLAGVLKPNM